MSWDAKLQPPLPITRSLEEEKVQAARLTVCRKAKDVEDARLLLEILGLLPEPDDTGVASDD